MAPDFENDDTHTHTPYTVRYDIYDVLINGFVAPCAIVSAN